MYNGVSFSDFRRICALFSIAFRIGSAWVAVGWNMFLVRLCYREIGIKWEESDWDLAHNFFFWGRCDAGKR